MLSPYTVTIYTKQDNPYNVIPDSPIEIRERLANGTSGSLSIIYSDQEGLIPITQTGAKANSNGQFTFYAEAAQYNAVYESQTVPVDVGLTADTLPSAMINNLSLPYVFDTVADMVSSAIEFDTDKTLYVKDIDTTYTVTAGSSTKPISSPNLASGFARLNVVNLMDLVQFGGKTDGSDNKAAIEEASTLTNLITLRNGSYTFSSAPTLPPTFSVVAANTSSVIGVTIKELQGMFIDAGVIQGYLHIPELHDKEIGVVAGVIRQDTLRTVSSLVSSGAVITVTSINHDYESGDLVKIQGADDNSYNGAGFVISNVTTNTFDYTALSIPSTSPDTGTLIRVNRPSLWQWIKDGTHEPIGVDDSTPAVATANGIRIPYTTNYSKVISFIAAPDETLAKNISFACGASVATDEAFIQASANLTLAARVRYDGANWAYTYGSGQGGFGDLSVKINSESFAGNTLELNHDWLGGINIGLTPNSFNGTVAPYIPVLRGQSNNQTLVNFMDPITGSFVGVEDTKMCMQLTKNFSGNIPLDGGGNTSDVLNLSLGNIWIFGIFQV